MRVSVEVSGYFDWVPVPDGTKISEEDVKTLRVKQMADEKWHMRVQIKCEAGKAQSHDVGLHEEQICQRMAALEKLGRAESREQVVIFMLKESFRHHLSPSNMKNISVHDDGPNKEMFKAALDAAGVVAQDDAMAQYMEPTDMEAYLNTVFKTASSKAAKAPKGK